MKLKFVLGTAPLLATILMAATAAQADTFDVRQNAQRSSSASLPTRGMTMAQVEQRYGAPIDKMPTAGGDAPRHPPINRWRYNSYTVYFERSRVITSVMNPAPPPST